MPMPVDVPQLERPRFFDGERLTAADLLAVQTYERRLRWLHNSCLHAWGVALGLAVGGTAGDQTVTVGAGYALDCDGRDLVVPQAVTLQVPPVAGDGSGNAVHYLLTASYAEDADLPAETRRGECDTSGAVRLPEQAVVRWQTTSDTDADTRYRPGLDVVLAAADVKGCKLAAAPSTGEREEANVVRPYVACGHTPAGATAWRQWPTSYAPVGIATTVTTSAAAFAATPSYQAVVLGTRTFYASSGMLSALDGFVHVENATATSFDAVVALPSAANDMLNPPEVLEASFLDRFRDELSWTVGWVGIEP